MQEGGRPCRSTCCPLTRKQQELLVCFVATHISPLIFSAFDYLLFFLFLKAYHPLVRRGFELLVAKFKGKLTRDLMATENVVNVVRMIKVSPIRLTFVTKIRMC